MDKKWIQWEHLKKREVFWMVSTGEREILYLEKGCIDLLVAFSEDYNSVFLQDDRSHRMPNGPWPQ